MNSSRRTSNGLNMFVPSGGAMDIKQLILDPVRHRVYQPCQLQSPDRKLSNTALQPPTNPLEKAPVQDVPNRIQPAWRWARSALSAGGGRMNAANPGESPALSHLHSDIVLPGKSFHWIHRPGAPTGCSEQEGERSEQHPLIRTWTPVSKYVNQNGNTQISVISPMMSPLWSHSAPSSEVTIFKVIRGLHLLVSS